MVTWPTVLVHARMGLVARQLTAAEARTVARPRVEGSARAGPDINPGQLRTEARDDAEDIASRFTFHLADTESKREAHEAVRTELLDWPTG